MKKIVKFLESKRLYLRPVEMKDISTLQRFINDRDVRRYLYAIYPISLKEEEEVVQGWMRESSENVILAVVKKQGNVLLGTLALHKINHPNGTAFTGFALGEKKEWNKGYGTEAKMLLLEYAFHTLNLRKICSEAVAPNKGSIKHNEKCGYKLEGVRKAHIYRDGKYHDLVQTAVFREDWEKIFQKQQKTKTM